MLKRLSKLVLICLGAGIISSARAEEKNPWFNHNFSYEKVDKALENYDFNYKFYDINIEASDFYPGELIKIEIKEKSSVDLEEIILEFDNKKYPIGRLDKNSLISFIPLDLEIKPSNYSIKLKTKVFGKIKTEEYGIDVEKKEFIVQNIKLPKEKLRKSYPSQKDLERIEREKKEKAIAFSKITGKKWEGNFIEPLLEEYAKYGWAYGARRFYSGQERSRHKGLDYPVPLGTEVRATNSGKVVLAEELFFEGNTIIVDHGFSIFSLYLHLKDIYVKSEEKVEKGQIIGTVGASGRATGPHLHYETRVNGISVNPRSLKIID